MAAFSLTTATNLFKINYYKRSDNMYNSENVVAARTINKNDFTGKSRFVATPMSFSGGVGSGTLPTANVGTYGDALILAKKVYATCEIDRESIKASMDNEGAFVKATQETIKKTVESYMRNKSRILFGDATGTVGTISANATGTAAAPVVIISAATWKEANFEEKDYLNVDSGTDLFEVTAVDPATRSVTLARLSGAVDLTATGSGSVLYMQGSKDNDPEGFKSVIRATSGSIYNIAVQRRWQSTQVDALGAGVTSDRMNRVMLDIERKSGKVPNLIVMSYVQFRKFIGQLEEQKRYNIDPRSKDLVGKISFSGLEFMSTKGAVPVVVDRFCEDDSIYFLNDNYIECHHRPDFGWFDDDGTVFLRKSSSDAYEARYGGYYQNYIIPTYQGVLYNLAV